MGKRIPGKKHRGVKDPLVQKANREELLKNKINAPPKEVDYQEMPKSVERIIMLKQLAKGGQFDKQKNKKKMKKKIPLLNTSNFMGKDRFLSGMSKPERNLPALVQRPGERNGAFLHRVSQATNDFIKEVNFEVKHNMKMKRDEKTGKVKFDKIELHPVDKMFQDKLDSMKKKKKGKQKKKGNVTEEVAAVSKTARRRLRVQARKQHQTEVEGEHGDHDDGFEGLKDTVQFNEVVHRPPQLTALPRRANIEDSPASIARRPAIKGGLLLSKMLEPSDAIRRDLTGKRKDLSASDRRRLDSAQATAVEAYRQMKAAKSTRVT